jgi:hypothetical protein
MTMMMIMARKNSWLVHQTCLEILTAESSGRKEEEWTKE